MTSSRVTSQSLTRCRARTCRKRKSAVVRQGISISSRKKVTRTDRWTRGGGKGLREGVKTHLADRHVRRRVLSALLVQMRRSSGQLLLDETARKANSMRRIRQRSQAIATLGGLGQLARLGTSRACGLSGGNGGNSHGRKSNGKGEWVAAGGPGGEGRWRGGRRGRGGGGVRGRR